MSILSLLGNPLIRYGALALALFSLAYMKSCEIKQEAFKAGENSVIQKTQKVQNERIKKARRARSRINTKRVRKGRDPYRRD